MTSSKPQYPEPGSYDQLSPAELVELYDECARTLPQGIISDEEAAKRQAQADGFLAMAGHEITDPVIRQILWRHTKGEITGDEARALVRQHVLGD